MIDILRTTRRLTDAGLEQRQAEALAGVLHDVYRPSRATKAEVSLIASEFAGALETVKAHLVASQVIVAIALFVALRFSY